MAKVNLTRKTADRILSAVAKVEASDTSGKAGRSSASSVIQAVFAVRVTTDGGSAGSLTTTCSFTYTVKQDSGYELGTGLSPQKRRLPNVPYAATPASSWGLATRDKTGALVLLDANELPLTEDPCSS